MFSYIWVMEYSVVSELCLPARVPVSCNLSPSHKNVSTHYGGWNLVRGAGHFPEFVSTFNIVIHYLWGLWSISKVRLEKKRLYMKMQIFMVLGTCKQKHFESKAFFCRSLRVDTSSGNYLGAWKDRLSVIILSTIITYFRKYICYYSKELFIIVKWYCIFRNSCKLNWFGVLMFIKCSCLLCYFIWLLSWSALRETSYCYSHLFQIRDWRFRAVTWQAHYHVTSA